MPQGTYERLFAVLTSLISWVLAAFFISALTSEMTRLHIMASQQARQVHMLQRYLKQNKISDHLSLRVQRNAQHAVTEQQRLMPESEVELLQMVSEPLRVELHFDMYAPVIEVHPYFREYVQECPQVMRKVCHDAMSTLLMSGGDLIFNAGEMPATPKMYIVCFGTLNYIPITGDVITVHHEMWVSEAALWTPWMHRGVLKATSEGRMCCLDAVAFQDIAGCFEHSDLDPKRYAAWYVKHLNSLLEQGEFQKLTDLPLGEERVITKRAMDADFKGSLRMASHNSKLMNMLQKNKRRSAFFMDTETPGKGIKGMKVLKVMNIS